MIVAPVIVPKSRATKAAPTSARRANERRPRLLALGDLVLDIVVRAEKPVLSGSDVRGDISFRVGGSAANACRTFTGLGGVATFVGAVGDDLWGRRLAASLRRDGVRVHAVATKGSTARLVALIGPRGERSFVTQRGAADMLRASHVKRAWLEGIDILHLPAYSLLAEPLSRAALMAVSQARQAGALISVDLASRGPLLAEGREAARSRITEVSPHLLLANTDEAGALAGRPGLRRLLELAPVVVIKEGSAGCRVLWRSLAAPDGDVLQLDVATTPLDAPDTTGAGDAFDAGFLHSLAEQSAVGRGGSRDAVSGETRAEAMRRAHVLRRAAVGGHRAAARVLGRPRPELVL